MSRTASVRQLPQVKPLLAVILLGPAASAAAVADPRDELTPFLKSHCYECHGPETAKGGLRLDTLDHNPANEATFSHWQDVLSQLRLGDMPPPQKPQPEAAEKNAIIELLSATLRDARTGPETHAPPPAIRRLNRIELRNTLRDLLHLQQPVFRNLGIAKPEDANGDGTVSRNSEDPVREFPADEREHGFDTIGSRLVMSATPPRNASIWPLFRTISHRQSHDNLQATFAPTGRLALRDRRVGLTQISMFSWRGILSQGRPRTSGASPPRRWPRLE